MADTITGGNDIGVWAFWPANIPEKMWEYWLKYETGSFSHCVMSFLKHDVPQHRKDKLVTEMYGKSYSSSGPQWRSI